MEKETLKKLIRYRDLYFQTSGYDLVEIKGRDASEFFSRQLATNIKKIKNNKFLLVSRLERAGKFHHIFIY